MGHDESTNYLWITKNVFQHIHECSSTKGKEGATWCWLFHHMFMNGWCAGAEEMLIRAGQRVPGLLIWTVWIWESVTQTQTHINASTCYCFRRVWHLTCHTLPAHALSLRHVWHTERLQRDSSPWVAFQSRLSLGSMGVGLGSGGSVGWLEGEQGRGLVDAPLWIRGVASLHPAHCLD